MTRGRPKGTKNKKYTVEEKLRIVNLYVEGHLSSYEIAKREGIHRGTFTQWIYKYLKDGEKALVNKRKTGNHFSTLHTSKNLTKEERLDLENMKLKIEVERLKKGYIVKGVGASKEYVSINKKSSQ